jgi:alpha-L-fucosidase
MFIHWGLYSLAGHGEWMMHQEHIPPDEYAPLARQFNPRQYDARDWVRVVQDAGMRYVVLTTRHHDGFCLWDSKASNFTSAKTAAVRTDPCLLL